MKKEVLLTALSTVLVFSACAKDDEPLQEVVQETRLIVGTRTNGDASLSYKFNDDGILIVENAQIPSRSTFDMEIDGHAWRLVSQGFILPDGTIKDNNKGNRNECILLLQQRRMAIISVYTFAPKDNSLTYGNFNDYDEQNGSIGFFNVVKLSSDGLQMVTISEMNGFLMQRRIRPSLNTMWILTNI